MVNLLRPPRYTSLDGYRFFAASGVVLFHFDPDFHLGLAQYVPAVKHLSTFVDFFFMLSGFVITVGYIDRLTSWTEYGHFLRARIARIYPLHLATLGLFLAFVALAATLRMPLNHPEIAATSGLPANVFLLHGWGVLDHSSFNVPSWSISAEWFVYLAAPLFFVLARRVPMALNALLVTLFICVMTIWRSHAGLGSWMDATYDYGMLRAVPTFFLGVVLAQLITRPSLPWSPPWWLVHGLFFLALVLLDLDVPREALLPVFALLIAAAALADRAGTPSLMKGRLVSALGQGSYALYMLHVLMSVPVLLVLRRMHRLDTGWSLLAAVALYVVVVLMSVASYRYFETPLRKRIMSVRVSGAMGRTPRSLSSTS